MIINTICNIYNFSEREKQLLHHFIKHYRDKLVTNIVFICDTDNKEFISFCIDQNIKYHTFKFSKQKPHGQQDSSRINYVKDLYKEWYIPVDLDEFIEFKSNAEIEDIAVSCKKNQYKYISGLLSDKFTGKLAIRPSIDYDKEIFIQFPYSDFFTRDKLKGCINKVCLCDPDVYVGAGHHSPKNHLLKPNPQYKLTVNHYKWFGDVLILEEEKMNMRKSNNNNWYKEQELLLKIFSLK
jgi:hypothetical protein